MGEGSINSGTPVRAGGGAFLPRFCSGRVVLMVMVITEITAVLLALAGEIGESDLWSRLFLLSLYLQWIGLSSAAVLCLARRVLARGSRLVAVAACYLLLLFVTAVISELAYWIVHVAGLGTLVAGGSREIFLLRSMAVCGIVSGLALRYFYVQNQWRDQVEASAETRFQALQARIRPHFLFNSLNSIAALIHTQPDAAEDTVVDLAELFRVTLKDPERLVPLRDELEVTRRYLNIESLRLGSRLTLDWQVEEGLQELRVPLLCLQPLLENAVYHGIQQLPEGGEIAIKAARKGTSLILEVLNPVPEEQRPSRGERLALNNIRERLRLIYEGRARLKASRHDNVHHVILSIPLKESADEASYS